MKRLALAAVGGSILAWSLAASALAVAPAGSVTVEQNGCSFMVHIALDQGWPVVAWKVKVYDATNWKDGETLIKGSVTDDADGKIDAGRYTLPEGHYNVVVDNEATIDGSAIVQDFTLSCPSATPTPTGGTGGTTGPTPTPTEQPTSKPTQTPSGGVGNVNGGGTGNVNGGTGNVNGAVGGVSATLPPTDTTAAVVPAASDQGILPLIAGFAVLVVIFALATPSRIFRRLGGRDRDR